MWGVYIRFLIEHQWASVDYMDHFSLKPLRRHRSRDAPVSSLSLVTGTSNNWCPVRLVPVMTECKSDWVASETGYKFDWVPSETGCQSRLGTSQTGCKSDWVASETGYQSELGTSHPVNDWNPVRLVFNIVAKCLKTVKNIVSRAARTDQDQAYISTLSCQ